MGFCVPPRPSVRIGFIAPADVGSTDPWNVTAFLPGPRGFSRSYRANRTIPVDRLPTSGLRPVQGFVRHRCRGTSPATASLRVFSPFDGSGSRGFALGCQASGLRHLSGLVTRLTPLSPRRTSPECFVRVHPWGFPLQGFCFGPDREHLSMIACPPAVSVSVSSRGDRTGFRASPRSKSPPGADCYVGVGPLPSWGFSPLQGFQPAGLSAGAEPPQASHRRRTDVRPPGVIDRPVAAGPE